MTTTYTVTREGDQVKVSRKMSGSPFPDVYFFDIQTAKFLSTSLASFARSRSSRTLTIAADYDETFTFSGPAYEASRLAGDIYTAAGKDAA